MYRTCLSKTILAVIAMTLLPAAVVAGVWESESKATSLLRYNDNPALQPSVLNPKASFTGVGILASDWKFKDPNQVIAISPKIVGNYYFDSDFQDLNGVDYFLKANINRSRQLTGWGISTSVSHENILSSEDTDPNDPDNGGDGNFFLADDYRTRFIISPSFDWTPTPNDFVGVNVSYTIAKYDLAFTNRSDYDTSSAALVYQRSLNERHSVGFTANGYNYTSDRSGLAVTCDGNIVPEPGCIDVVPTLIMPTVGVYENNSSGYSLNLDYSYQWSDITTLKASFGRQTSDIESTVTVPTDRLVNTATYKSDQYLIGIVSNFELTELELNISQSITPSSNGSPSDKTQIQAAVTRRFTDRLGGNLAVVAYRSKSANVVTVNESEFIRADASLNYVISRKWLVSGVYTFRNRNPTVVQLAGEPEINSTDSLIRKSHSYSLSLSYKF